MATLKEIAWVFLKIGTTGFGGPVVHIAMMEAELVRKRRWIDPGHFLDLIGATNLIPGPNSTEMTMHIGYEKAGWKGLLVAGCSFIVPAVLITGCLAWLYGRFGHLPDVQPFLYGVKPAILAVVASLMLQLGRKALKSASLWIIGLIGFGSVLAGLNEIYALFGCGLLGIVLQSLKSRSAYCSILPLAALALSAESTSSIRLFLIFLKIGAILYGSGYVLFGFLDAELVTPGYLAKQTLLDAIAVGQITPGPVFSSATFIGWQLAGASGAAAATAGIFLPSFLFVALLNPLIPKLRRSSTMKAFLDAVNVASIAIILSVLVEIGTSIAWEWRTILICIASFAVTFRFTKLNTAYTILGGSALGYAFHFL